MNELYFLPLCFSENCHPWLLKIQFDLCRAGPFWQLLPAPTAFLDLSVAKAKKREEKRELKEKNTD